MIDFNHYYPTTGKFGKWGSKPIATSLAQWQAACNCERNGNDGDPLLANASTNDFYLLRIDTLNYRTLENQRQKV